jgi:hypothetical protein
VSIDKRGISMRYIKQYDIIVDPQPRRLDVKTDGASTTGESEAGIVRDGRHLMSGYPEQGVEGRLDLAYRRWRQMHAEQDDLSGESKLVALADDDSEDA